MGKAPAFQFYAKDWLDMRVMRMSFEAQGVYMRLLAHMWADSDTQFSIENNSKMLSRMLGLSEKKFQKIFAEIQWPGDPIFIEEDGFLVSKRLRKEKEKQVKISVKRSEAAEGRWGKPDANASANAMQVQCKRDALQSSSSPSGIDENTTPLPPVAPAAPGLEPYSLEFLEFWDAYPNKEAQDDAWIAWITLKKDRKLPGLAVLQDAICAQEQGERWQDTKFIPSPGAWLRKGRWKDQPPPKAPARASPPGPHLTPRQKQTEMFKGMAQAIKRADGAGNGENNGGRRVEGALPAGAALPRS